MTYKGDVSSFQCKMSLGLVYVDEVNILILIFIDSLCSSTHTATVIKWDRVAAFWEHNLLCSSCYTWVYPKVPDWVVNEMYVNNNEHSLRSSTKGYGGKTH